MTRGRHQRRPSSVRPDRRWSSGPAAPAPGPRTLSPEHAQIVALLRAPQSIAEIAAHLDLPVGVVRVLLGDLLDEALVHVQTRNREPELCRTSPFYRAVIDGLRAL